MTVGGSFPATCIQIPVPHLEKLFVCYSRAQATRFCLCLIAQASQKYFRMARQMFTWKSLLLMIHRIFLLFDKRDKDFRMFTKANLNEWRIYTHVCGTLIEPIVVSGVWQKNSLCSDWLFKLLSLKA